MGKVMTLREAVEIDRLLLPRVEDYADLGAYVKALDEFHRKRVRARSIVEAAVRFVEADGARSGDALKELRVLEHGGCQA